MSSKFLFDSFAWMEYLNGTDRGKKISQMLEKAESGEVTIFTPILVLAELSDRLHRDGKDVTAFFEFINTNSIITQITIDIAFKAGIVKNELRAFSKNISLSDCIHFQTAKSVGAAFVTGDPDFKDVKGVVFL